MDFWHGMALLEGRRRRLPLRWAETLALWSLGLAIPFLCAGLEWGPDGMKEMGRLEEG